MNSHEQNHELISLLELALEGLAGDSDRNRLAELLSHSPDARLDCIKYLDMHVALEQYRAIAASDRTTALDKFPAVQLEEEGLPQRVAMTTAIPKWRWNVHAWAALSGAILIVFTVLALNWKPEEIAIKPAEETEQSPQGAVLTAVHNCHFVETEKAQQGKRVYTLSEGVARLTYPQGTESVISAPVELVPDSDGRAVLRRGRMVIDVPATASEFVVETPLVKIFDQGAKCAIFVTTENATELCVLDGQVRIESQNVAQAGLPSQRLRAGQALRIRLTGQQLVIEPIEYAPQQFTVKLPERGLEQIHCVIHDRTLHSGKRAIDPLGSQEITVRQFGGIASQDRLESRQDFGVVQDWSGFSGWNFHESQTNILVFDGKRPDVEFRVRKLQGDDLNAGFGSECIGSDWATSGDSSLRLGFVGKQLINSTHQVVITFGSYREGKFSNDRAVEGSCFTINNINGGSPRSNDTTRYRAEFFGLDGKTLYCSEWIDVASPKGGDLDKSPRPNALFAYLAKNQNLPTEWISQIVITEERRGGSGSGNQMGFDDFGFTSSSQLMDLTVAALVYVRH